MKCFQFCSGEKKKEPPNTRKTSSVDSFFSSENRQSGYGRSDTTSKSSGFSQSPNLSKIPTNLRAFTLLELKHATKNFSNSGILGEGGFGRVFKGVIRSTEDNSQKINVAIKQLSRRGLQGHKEWLTEVSFLGVVEHPNLVKLIGYCAEDDERGIERLLIYEYMPNGSLENHLYRKCATALPWATRLKIALDAARGLAYLHEGMDFQIIFRDFKASNILLDENWNAKLSDFGLARLGPSEGRSHVTTRVSGTMGYAAPEYIRTGHLKAKSDVWSYGVFLYELITGRRPIDRYRPKIEQDLLEWIKPYISDCKKFHHIIDPRFEKKQVLRSARKLGLIANRCLAKSPKARPKMCEVREMVNEVLEASMSSMDLPSPSMSPFNLPMSSRTTKESEAKGKRRITDLKTNDRPIFKKVSNLVQVK